MRAVIEVEARMLRIAVVVVLALGEVPLANTDLPVRIQRHHKRY